MQKRSFEITEVQSFLEQRGIQIAESPKGFTVTYDDGNKCFEAPVMLIPVQALHRKEKTADENLLEVLVYSSDKHVCEIVQITARQFETRHWLTETIGCSSGLMMTAEEYAILYEHALQIAKGMPQVTVITDSGWCEEGYAIGDKLIPRDGVKAEEAIVRTGETAAEMGCDQSLENDYIAGRILTDAFKILKAGKIAALISIFVMALLYEDIRDRNPQILPRFVTIIHGFTNNGKTTVTKKLLTPFVNHTTIMSAQSTAKVIQRTLQNTYSCILAIDDFPPSMTRAERIEKSEAIVRVCGDAGAQRVTCDDLRAGSRPIGAMAAITAEDYYIEGTSSIARTLSVPIDMGECNFEAVERLDNNILPTFGYRFIQYYLDNNGLAKLTAYFEARREQLLSTMNMPLRRMTDNYALIMAVWNLICNWLLEAAEPELKPMIETYTSDLVDFIKDSAAYQREVLDSQNEALLFLRELKRLISMDEAKYVKLTTNNNNHYEAASKEIQAIYKTDTYLYMNVNFEEKIRKDLAKDKKIVSGRRKLREMMKTQGILVADSDGPLSTRLTVNNDKHSYIQLRRKKVDEIFERCE